jgi:hypothetical protein
MLVWGPGGPHANTRVEVHMANTQELIILCLMENYNFLESGV